MRGGNEVALLHHNDITFSHIPARTKVVADVPAALQVTLVANSIHLPFHVRPGPKRYHLLAWVELPLRLRPH